MKTVLLITICSFLMAAKSCGNYEGDTVGNLYPSQGVARVRTITQSCPLKTTSATMVALDSKFDGWCMVPPDKCGDYKTDYDSKCD